MLNKLKPFAVHLAVAAVVLVGGTAAAATLTGSDSPFNSQEVVTNQDAVEKGQEAPQKGPAQAVPTNEPASDTETGVGETESGTPANSGSPASITPGVPTNEPQEPAAPVAPPVTRTGHVMRFVDASPADKPNTVAQEYCDYSFSDGSVQTELKATIRNFGGFSQPISSYSETNPPNNYSPC